MLEYKNCTGVLVFNDAGELALQLRAAGDDSFPSHWDFSAGGGIDPGEDTMRSAERELREELGVEAPLDFVAQEHYQYPAWNRPIMREIDIAIYKAHHNGPFAPDPKEVQQVAFFTLDTIQEMMDAGEKFHPEFVLAWQKGIIARATGK